MSKFRFPKEGDRLSHVGISEDPKVKPWIAELALRSKLTSEVNLRRLGIFLHTTRLSTAGLLATASNAPDELRDMLIQYATEAKDREYLGTYIRRILVSVRSFLRFHGSTFDQFPRVAATDGESLVEERTPTPDELRLLLGGLSSRGRVVALLMAHAGLRPGVLASVDATDGLTFAALPEVRVVSDHLEFEKDPFVILVPARLSKTRRSYLTFGSHELREALDVYVRERLARGERIERESPLVASTGQGRGEASRVGRFLKPAGEFVSTKALTFDLREAIRKVRPGGQTFRPYALRAFCSTQLLLAESKGLIVRDARELFLGHNLGPAGRYNLGKKLHPTVVEELRSMYSRASDFLSTLPRRTDRTEEIQREAAVLLLTGLRGKSEEEARAMVDGKVGEELANLLKSSERMEKAVPVEDVQRLLDSGWSYVAPLNGSMAVLRAPSVVSSGEAPLPQPDCSAPSHDH